MPGSLSNARKLKAAEILRSFEQGGPEPPQSPLVLGWDPGLTDSPLDALKRGATHEWIAAPSGVRPSSFSTAPLLVVAHAARVAAAPERSGDHGRWLVWIGRSCWPCPAVIPGVLDRSIWVDPPDAAARLWAIDIALRCAGVGVVVADAGGIDMAGSRRLQLAAEAGSTVGLLVRPARESKALSAAASRWLVAPAPTVRKKPRWTVDLVRCKGTSVARDEPRRFVVEWDHAQGAVVVPSELVGRPAEAARPGEGRAVDPGARARVAG